MFASQSRAWPGQSQSRTLDGGKAFDGAWRGEGFFNREAQIIRQVTGGNVLPLLDELLDDLVAVNVSRHGIDHVVGHIHPLVKVINFVTGDLQKLVEITNRRMTGRVVGITRLLGEFPEDAVGATHAMFKLTLDDLAFAFVFGLRDQ